MCYRFLVIVHVFHVIMHVVCPPSMCNIVICLFTSDVYSCRYDFVPPVKYDYLNADEAEKKFEERHKTLNYFSVMLSKKLREQEGEEGEGKGVGGEGEEGGSMGGVAGKKKAKKKESVSNLVRETFCYKHTCTTCMDVCDSLSLSTCGFE